MARLAPPAISLSENEHLQLKELANRHNTPQQIALRAQIILLANTGKNNREIARELEKALRFQEIQGNPKTPDHSGSISLKLQLKLLMIFIFVCEGRD